MVWEPPLLRPLKNIGKNKIMKRYIFIINLLFSFISFSQNYTVKKESNQLQLLLDEQLAATSQIGFDDGTAGIYTFKNGTIFQNSEIVGTYDEKRLFIEDSVYKFRTPGFSSYSKIKDKNSKLQIATLFQESKDNVVVTIDNNLMVNDKELITSWMLYKQLKDIEENNDFDFVTYAILGAMAGLLLN